MARRWNVLALVSVGVFMVSLDLFIVNIAFPKIEGDFAGASVSSISWVLNAYAIVLAACMVSAGRLADRPAASAPSCGSGDLRARLGALRARAVGGGAGRRARRPGRGRRVPPPDLARAAPAGVRAEGASAGDRHLGGHRRPRRGGRASHRRPARRAQLATRLPGQRPDRSRRDRLRRAVAARESQRGAGAARHARPALVMVAVGVLSLGLVEAPEWGWGTRGRWPRSRSRPPGWRRSGRAA